MKKYRLAILLVLSIIVSAIGIFSDKLGITKKRGPEPRYVTKKELVTDVNMSGFQVGDTLALDMNNPGGMIKATPETPKEYIIGWIVSSDMIID